MAKGMSPTKERCITLKCDKDLPFNERSRFYYKILTAEQYADIQNRLVEVHGGDDEGGKDKSRTLVMSGTQVLEVLRLALTRVENYVDDEKGLPILWPESGKEKKNLFLTTMRRAWRQELAEGILEGQIADEAQLGESSSASGSA